MRVESGLCHEKGTESGSAVLLRHPSMPRSDIYSTVGVHCAEESGKSGKTRPEEWWVWGLFGGG